MSGWIIDVDVADHDAVKRGVLVQRVSRVILSRAEFPDPLDAEVCAAQFATAMRGGMPTKVRHCI